MHIEEARTPAECLQRVSKDNTNTFEVQKLSTQWQCLNIMLYTVHTYAYQQTSWQAIMTNSRRTLEQHVRCRDHVVMTGTASKLWLLGYTYAAILMRSEKAPMRSSISGLKCLIRPWMHIYPLSASRSTNSQGVWGYIMRYSTFNTGRRPSNL